MSSSTDTPTTIPVTVEGTLARPGGKLVIGTTSYKPQGDYGFWLIVLDLKTLKVVVNEVYAGNDSVPPAVQQIARDETSLLILTTIALTSASIPHGAFYQFLRQIGSGAELARLEQVVGQLGTGGFVRVGYVLAATFSELDASGFEAMSWDHIPILTFLLRKTDVNGVIRWYPARLR